MRIVRVFSIVLLVGLSLTLGCSTGGPSAGVSRGGSGGYVGFSGSNNPTSQAGRGEPSMDDQFRPPAWVFIDGQAGEYTEENGKPQLQWVIKNPVSSKPTFRVEVYMPLVGAPDGFSSVLRSLKISGDKDVNYAIGAKDDTFVAGKEYSLTNPGSDFVIRNGMTRDIVVELPELPAGVYALACSIGNSKKNVKALAVTYFTVGE